MKLETILLFLLIGCNSLFAQDDLIILEQYIVTKVISNCKEISEALVDNPIRFSIYIIEGSQDFYFAKVYAKSKVLTYGIMSDIKIMNDLDLENSTTNILSFNWDYIKNTNSVRSVSKIAIEKETNGNSTLIKTTIFNDYSEKNIYVGYMDADSN
ncbi:hypothetical protein [Bizionia arctica]|uniref:Uncharacterized protein n=1 Tax=Bizionia arctica TaxID=1495645 RepID=A0A917GN54_9FLAO|nr:hypothetical protein [Bizionia arctica]GGG51824.1 hypothetical protein GCM10010976_23740 [Bizionia arctica]